MKKKVILFFLLLPLLVAAAFVAYCYVFETIENDKKYYFPQIETYLKMYKPPFNKYGYVFFCRDSIFSFSEKMDFVKIYKSGTSSVSFIFNPLENNKIFIVDRWNNIQINQVNFIIEKINWEDTTFFEQEIVAGVNTYILKSSYFEVFIEGHLQSVFFTDYDIGEYPIKAEPIN